jgi:hypothetical protein
LLPLDREYDEGEKTLALLLPELLSIGRRIALRDVGHIPSAVRKLNPLDPRRHHPPTGPALGRPDDRVQRAIQYSRDADDGVERPQRTGRFRGYDDRWCGYELPQHIQSSYADLTRVSINLRKEIFRNRWMAGTSARQ